VEQHLSLVQSIARKLRKQITARIDFDDLVGYGSKGLIEAAERFDPRHGVAFTTFAYYRIRGAMLDGLRTMGWYSRADYARYRAEERATQYLQNRSEREGAAASGAREGAPAPDAAAWTDAEAAAGGASVAASGAATADLETHLAGIAEILGGIATVHITSLEAASGVADESLPPPDASLDTGRLSARVQQAIKALPDKERQLMELYYFAGKNLEEAGATMGLSKSWACRLHARAVDLLRVELADALD
jgi:RNA polymerase sigma factor for flagellar operon FliA